LRSDRAHAATQLAHADLLTLWARTLALRALDAPIYPAPYDRACHPYDLASVRADAARAWAGRDDAHGAGIDRVAIWNALALDPFYPHVAALATNRMRRLGIGSLPTFDTDEAGWLGVHVTRRALAYAALPSGSHCGPAVALFGFATETARATPVAATER